MGMIVAEHREGDLTYVPHEDPSKVPGFFRSLDRNLSLGLKLIVPVIVITLVGTTGFGLYEAEQTNFEVDRTYETSAAGAAQAAASAFYNTFAISEGINIYLADLASGLPNVKGVWVVNLAAPGTPV